MPDSHKPPQPDLFLDLIDDFEIEEIERKLAPSPIIGIPDAAVITTYED